ncbi:glycosyltransferase family 9 protein [Mitsuaria sp. GD03876]|uniref:glycosyltransferase family 9 protein n=1 Tax=Mitsuaria sp. GD03876 TaxID=2975399 RepID=UPI00244C0223|nr:glycosyltransferase family 9 protein [Mitsuaria sp. GD03876]MDH0868155.1 glycosyltransferase family 9 protein [Mitsuaria sp. GD03876]
MTAGAAVDHERIERWRSARRVLLIRLDNLGDVLMTTPAIAAVRESLPDARLTLLAAPSMAGLAPHLPEVDEIVGFHAPWMKAGATALDAMGSVAESGPDRGAASRGGHERDLLARLMKDRHDAAIVFTVCTQSVFPAATLCRLAGIPNVAGHARERAYGLLSDEIPDRDEICDGMRHEVRRQLDLVAALGMRTRDERLRFRVLDGDRIAVRRALDAAGLRPGQPFVLLHPGASAPSRRYPAGRFGEAARQLRQALAPAGDGLGARRVGGRASFGGTPPAIVLCGGPGEEGLVREMRDALGGEALLPTSTSGIGELGALIAEADLLIANNSGPVHLAAAVGTPVVDLYALTNPQHTPWLVPSRVLFHDVPCRFCQKSVCPEGHHACLTGVMPDQVAEAAISLLHPPGRRPAATASAEPGDPTEPGDPAGPGRSAKATAPARSAELAKSNESTKSTESDRCTDLLALSQGVVA